MQSILLHIADYLLYILHILIISINIFGWIFKKTRKLQLITILVTAASWFLLGIWFGWGYCFLTDWEWNIKRRLGETDLPHSFVHYLTNNSLGLNISSGVLDLLTLILFAVALLAGVILNIMDYRKKKIAGTD